MADLEKISAYCLQTQKTWTALLTGNRRHTHIIPCFLRSPLFYSAMDPHHRRPIRPGLVVPQSPHLLAAERMGSGTRGLVAEFSQRPSWHVLAHQLEQQR